MRKTIIRCWIIRRKKGNHARVIQVLTVGAARSSAQMSAVYTVSWAARCQDISVGVWLLWVLGTIEEQCSSSASDHFVKELKRVRSVKIYDSSKMQKVAHFCDRQK